MTLNEAALLLGVDPGTLRVQVNNGKLRAKKVGPIWTVTRGEVERYRRESLGHKGRPKFLMPRGPCWAAPAGDAR